MATQWRMCHTALHPHHAHALPEKKIKHANITSTLGDNQQKPYSHSIKVLQVASIQEMILASLSGEAVEARCPHVGTLEEDRRQGLHLCRAPAALNTCKLSEGSGGHMLTCWGTSEGRTQGCCFALRRPPRLPGAWRTSCWGTPRLESRAPGCAGTGTPAPQPPAQLFSSALVFTEATSVWTVISCGCGCGCCSMMTPY